MYRIPLRFYQDQWAYINVKSNPKVEDCPLQKLPSLSKYNNRAWICNECGTVVSLFKKGDRIPLECPFCFGNAKTLRMKGLI